MNNREETIKDFALGNIQPHLNDIEELSMQMRNIIKELAEKCDMEDECECIANHELVQFHIQKILEILGFYE